MVRSRKINVISACIVIGFTVLSVTAITGGFNQFVFKGFPYLPPLAKLSGDAGVTGYGYDYEGFLLLDHDPPLPYADRFNLQLKASALSAQNPIEVISEINFNEESISEHFKENYYTGKELLFIVFPNSYQYDPFQPPGKFHAFITLIPQDPPNNFKGSGKIIYPFQGEYGYLFLSTEDMKKTLAEDNTWDLTAVLYRNQNDTIKIESASVTGSIQSNNIFLTLTFIATAFGSIQILQHFSDKKK